MDMSGRHAPAETVASTRKFDLNIEEVLDGWEVRHGIREIIANALDEQALTGTADMQIRQNGGKSFTVRDRGRGIRPEHLTQNEDAEKMSGKTPVIGRFGVGLKDALAVLSRHGVNVRIRSRYCSLTTEPAPKHGFEDITTLHALVAPPDDPDMEGTEFLLDDVDPLEMEGAKSLFRRFSDEATLETTRYGDVLERKSNEPGRIYVNGVRVAIEDNFLFSYDITRPTKKMKRALNRERTNVGRQAYTDSVKSMLMEAKSKTVMDMVSTDAGRHETGLQHDESKWIDVMVRACKILNESGNVVFATAAQQRENANVMDDARREGLRVVTVPGNVGGRLSGSVDESGAEVRDMDHYVTELNDRFEFKYVQPAELTQEEKYVFGHTSTILKMVDATRLSSKVLISETMRPGRVDADGLWDGTKITVRRSTLSSLGRYAGVLLHEAAHALGSGAGDVSREFEMDLTDMLGRVAVQALRDARTARP